MSTVKSEPITPNRGRVSTNRIAAAGAWLIGLFFTYLFFARMAPAFGTLGALLASAGIQALLTLIERPLWRWVMRRKGGDFTLLSLGATLADAALNAGGLYTYIPRIVGTDVGKMFIDAFQLSPTVSAPAALGIAFLIGLLAASAPEALWEAN